HRAFSMTADLHGADQREHDGPAYHIEHRAAPARLRHRHEGGLTMRSTLVLPFAIAAIALTVSIGVTLRAQQDRYSLKVPNGLALSEFRGYDAWQTIAVSETEGSVKAILGNPTMIAAYKEGIPDNGQPFPEGSKTAKIEWIKKKNPASPYFVEVPDILKSL